MTRVIGLDLSLTSTGIADVTDSGIVLSTVTSKPTVGDRSYNAMSKRIETIVIDLAKALSGPRLPDLAVIEGPSFGSKGQHTHSRDWLWGRVFDHLRHWNIPTVVVTPSQRMKYVTGKGNAAKELVLLAAVKRWPNVEVTGNDVADALVLAAIGCRHLGKPIDTVPASHWSTVMEKIAS